MKGLGVDISKFRVGTEAYKIPEIAADIFKVYLTLDSSKGSIISKIKTGKIDKISKEERKELVSIMKERIKATNKYDEKIIDEFFKYEDEKLEYNKRVSEKLSEIKVEINDKIDTEITEFTQISKLDGFIVVNDNINNTAENFEHKYHKFNDPDVLSEDDRLILCEYLISMIDETLENWRRLNSIASTVKIESISDEEFMDETKVLCGDELLKEAIIDYKKEIERKHTPLETLSDNEIEETGKILEEIKMNLKLN